MAEHTDDRLIILSPDDTIAVARCGIGKGEDVVLAGQSVQLAATVSMGHKLALRPMALGDKVLKYGVPIGSATAEIAVGDHVHLHNMKSDYTPTYALTKDGKIA
ncbi:MAG: hypothetical protein ACI86S_000269 [Paracoccaceae bacterium]|jgi:hypothetical protein